MNFTYKILGQFILYNASAGSGKTYTLVFNILKQLIKAQSPWEIQAVLAVTFTNKAAKEMKYRLLEDLYVLSVYPSKKSDTIEQLSNELLLSYDEISLRSEKIYSHILHHYSILNITTIDKFSLQLIRSFSKELQLSSGFHIKIHSKKYIEKAAHQLLDRVGNDASLTDIVIQFVFREFDSGNYQDVSKELVKKAKLWEDDLNKMYMKQFHHLSEKEFTSIYKLLQSEKEKLTTEVSTIAKQQYEHLQSLGLQISDFKQNSNGYMKFLDNYANGEYTLISEPKYKNFSTGDFTNKTTPSSIKDTIQSVEAELIDTFFKLYTHTQELEIIETILSQWVYLQLNAQFNTIIDSYKQEENFIFISDFNLILSEFLIYEPSAFIYEKLGNKLRYVYIDEFQDTNPLQWNNFQPIKENILAVDDDQHSFTLVGDPKQSLYRFRGADSDIILDFTLHPKEQHIDIKNLQFNWRSGKNIVTFNNVLYTYIREHSPFPEKTAQLFDDEFAQEYKKPFNGRVAFCPVQPSDTIDYPEFERIYINIQEALEHGYLLDDIIILVRKNFQIKELYTFLLEKGLSDILTEGNLRLDRIPFIKAVIAYLRALLYPNEIHYLADFIFYYGKIKNWDDEHITSEIVRYSQLKDKAWQEAKSTVCKDFPTSEHEALSIYNFMEDLCRNIEVDPENQIYVSSFLQIVQEQMEQGVQTITDFLEYWDNEGWETGVSLPATSGFLNIMTVHKSKGLQFPVVIYYHKTSSTNNYSGWISVPEKFSPLKRLYTTKKLKHHGFQKYNTEIKEQYFIDDLCVSYVATTRAEEQLYIVYTTTQQEGKELGALSSANWFEHFAHENQLSNGDIVDFYEDNDYTKIQTKEEKHPTETLSISFETESWKQKLQLSTPNLEWQKRDDALQWGKLFHAIMDRIDDFENPLDTVTYFKLQGKLNSQEEQIVSSSLDRILQHNLLKPLFTDYDKALTERDIFVDGQMYRPDRLVIKNNNWYIIDYKTGEESQKDQNQILQYKKVLEQMGKKVVAAYLVYCSPDDISVLSC